MIIEKKKLFVNIIYSISVVFYVVIGAGVLTIASYDFTEKTVLLSVLILLSSIPHILLYLINKNNSYLIIGLVGLAFSILFLTVRETDLFTADHICMIWGVIDICRGLTEIINVLPKVKKHKIELIEIGVSLGDIVIGTLLCIHLTHGTRLHLIYLAIAVFIIAAKTVFEYIFEKVRKKEDEGLDNN